MNLLPGIQSTASALEAQKVRQDIISQNIANAHTTRGPDGEAYQRKLVAFEAILEGQRTGRPGAMSPSAGGVRVRSIETDQTPGPLVHNPSHPDADAQGMVHMPNVNLAHEMVDLIAASRSYEANLTVVRTARSMAQQALQIGRNI